MVAINICGLTNPSRVDGSFYFDDAKPVTSYMSYISVDGFLDVKYLKKTIKWRACKRRTA